MDDRFPYPVYRLRAGTPYAVDVGDVPFPAGRLRQELAAMGWTTAELQPDVTLHHPDDDDAAAFAERDLPPDPASHTSWWKRALSARRPTHHSTLVVAPHALIDVESYSNHEHAAPRLRLLQVLAHSGPLRIRTHPDRDWAPTNPDRLVSTRTVPADGPGPRTPYDFAFRPQEGVFDVDRIEARLSGYWGWRAMEGWHLPIGDVPCPDYLREREPDRVLSYAGAPVVKVSEDRVHILPRSAEGEDQSMLRHFVHWLTTTWPCVGTETDYGLEFVGGVLVSHVYPPGPLETTWWHGFDTRSAEPPEGSGERITALFNEELGVAMEGAERAMADVGLVAWLLAGHEEPRLRAAPHGDLLVAMLKLHLGPPLGRNVEVDLTYEDLTAVPAEVWRLPELFDLDLSGNELTTLPAPTALPPLLHLNLTDNDLTEVPGWLGRLEQLERLNLSINPMTAESWAVALPMLRRLSTLKELLVYGIDAWDVDVVRAALPGVDVEG